MAWMSSAVPMLDLDPRVLRAARIYALSYLLIFVMAIPAVLWVGIGHVDPSTNNLAAGLFVGAGVVWIATTMGLYFRYYRTFVNSALEIPDGVSRGGLPRVVEAANPLQGEEFARRARVKTVVGASAICRIELYRNGIRIWRGPDHDQPSFSFLYSDLVQAEMATLLLGRGPNAPYVRLVASRPRMAFLISSRRWSGELIKRLGDHDVVTFGGAQRPTAGS